MIDSQGSLLCDQCRRRNHQAGVMGEIKAGVLTIWARHHGERHSQTVEFAELLPPPESEEYAAIVAELLRRIPGA